MTFLPTSRLFGSLPSVVESAPHSGKTFRAPMRPAPTVPDGRQAREGIIRGEGHILLVEDNGMVSHTATAMLTSFGYEVTHAADGAAALGLVREAPRRYDLVLLDLSMPGMSGEATFVALRAVTPELKILIWSGYAAEQDVADMLKRGAVGFVQKPSGVAQLSRTLAEALRAA